MKFSSTFFAIVFAALVASTEACKCVLDGKHYANPTHKCCNSVGGNFKKGDKDCAARSILGDFGKFRSCCHNWELKGHRLTSDCIAGKEEAASVEADDSEVVEAQA